ncbi:branched-chain amino acid ABC transporter permease [Tessaracoccus sp. ZS01]|uniref:branched-chain amino acid ABC transporter permease n=1 Tax=Tessaracoccus sp. ZS01 TaxID=1906324 RepID=UPI00096F5050|nr:branched-chain amino acid ABC transporter permease [Tessaracoccus sp. ZS01]MCG6567588.1 branched-chain amino acid ABC transporter permease [Tessaracoccus sp. ZS01]OMG55945.1 branched-chain amino acid ABC transporter permease [Tessaracoccus sp. ZS01]
MKRLLPREGRGYLIALVVVVALFVAPLLAIPGLGILPGPTYSAGSMHLMAFTMLMVAVVLSYHLIFGVAGLLSFGHALYFGVGVYGLAIVLRNTELPLLGAAAVVLVIGIFVANVLGAISLRVSGISFAMVTLAFAQAGNVLVRRNPGRLTGGEEGLSMASDNVPDFLIGVINTRNLYWVALITVAVVYVIVAWIENSRLGHNVAAVRENDTRVRVLGGRPYLVKLIAFAVGGTLATFTGMVFLLLQSGASATAVSTEFTISLLTMVVLGGVGSRWGAVVGAIIYTLLNQRLNALASSPAIADLPAILRIPLSEPMFILGTLFILIVLFLPGGVSGTLNRLTGRRRAREGREALEDIA